MDSQLEVLKQRLAAAIITTKPRERKVRKANGTPKRITRVRKGVINPLWSSQVRLRQSPYQAVAMGTGRGVLAPEGTVFTDSPQTWPAGWSVSAWTAHGRSTIQGV